MTSSTTTARLALDVAPVTVVPRWAPVPAAGTGLVETTLPRDVVDGLEPFGLTTALLAAHAKVLAALAGSDDVTAGYRPRSSAPAFPVPFATAADSTWRGLLGQATDVPAPAGTSTQERRFETVVQAAPHPLEEGLLVGVSLTAEPTGAVLGLRFRRDAVDGEYAARLAGYHVTALTHLARTGPEGVHRGLLLLSPAEVAHQVEGLAGPRRERPDRRVHELIEERVKETPDAVAVALGAEAWSFAELDARANRLAHALREAGVQRESVVAVVTERNLEWAAAVLAVLKAGGVYLPIEPHFPPARIAATLSRAACRFVLTEPGSTTTLDQALSMVPDGIRTMLVGDGAGHPEHDPGVAVDAGQLAYIYFTSGSTGEPKGAMCEHAGFLNHVLAKIEDLEIGADAVVAQTAPQCFDISLWQLVAALVTGGRTEIVAQEVILDVGRFAAAVHDAGVTVLQLVPSYLEALLTELEDRPRELPALRYVSATGEALKKELVQRWFASRPGVPLVNAYGLTETCDDTNHAVMRAVPEQSQVPLGPPVANVHVYVVDEHLDPVPLGAPGEIVFSGVCVGRGYVNDPERTARAFTADPLRPGQPLYRSGDLGHWRPDGSLEFLGRRDTQVKIRGFRIEIGEIDNALLQVPGVRDGAVVVTEGPDGSRHLVAFYAGPDPLTAGDLRASLARSLPEYMVPAVYHWREALPLTGNSKIDRKALTALAAATTQTPTPLDDDAPLPGTERRLATIWARVLGVPVERLGRGDHFFDRGGTSLSAVKVVAALDRAVPLKAVVSHPVLSDLAVVVDRAARGNPDE